MQKQFQQLLQKKMDRKDFLKHVAFGFVALTGATALIKGLNQTGSTDTARQAKEGGYTYGGGPYGGARKPQT